MTEKVFVVPNRSLKYTKDIVAQFMLKADELKAEGSTDEQIAKALNIPRRTYDSMRTKYRKKRHDYYRERSTEFITNYIKRQEKYIFALQEEGAFYKASQVDNALVEKLQSFGYVLKVSDKLQLDANVKTNWVDVLKKYKLIEEAKDERTKQQV